MPKQTKCRSKNIEQCGSCDSYLSMSITPLQTSQLSTSIITLKLLLQGLNANTEGN